MIRYLGGPGLRTVGAHILKEGRCVLCTKACGHDKELDHRDDMSACGSPSQAGDKDHIQHVF